MRNLLVYTQLHTLVNDSVRVWRYMWRANYINVRETEDPRAALDFERAGKTITHTRLYSFMTVVRNDMAACRPADLCITRTAFHRLWYTVIYTHARSHVRIRYVHRLIWTYTRIHIRSYSGVCTRHFCLDVLRVYVCVYKIERIRNSTLAHQDFCRSTNAYALRYRRDKCIATIYIQRGSYARAWTYVR